MPFDNSQWKKKVVKKALFKKRKLETFIVVYSECLPRIKSNIYWMFLILYYVMTQTKVFVSAISSI